MATPTQPPHFKAEIDLETTDLEIINLREKVVHQTKSLHDIQETIGTKEDRLRALRSDLHDEAKGAGKINTYLNHHFGHNRLSLVAETDQNADQHFKFNVLRDNRPAYNLSDGECSLIAFCYFMAKLEDAETAGNELIIYIDDPVSSLDNDHIFFVFGLIQSLIANPVVDQTGTKTYRYKQLFISTHNLDFLKFLKRLPGPKGGTAHFLLLRSSQGTHLELMPRYLKNYITEFHYLFDELCACANPQNVTADHRAFYNFGNNLRKFLEAYLFFRYPICSDNPDEDTRERIKRFFGPDDVSDPIVQRIANEFSHTVQIFDRALRPLDSAEISKTALRVLAAVRDKDPEQYKSLLDATSNTDPLTHI